MWRRLCLAVATLTLPAARALECTTADFDTFINDSKRNTDFDSVCSSSASPCGNTTCLEEQLSVAQMAPDCEVAGYSAPKVYELGALLCYLLRLGLPASSPDAPTTLAVSSRPSDPPECDSSQLLAISAANFTRACPTVHMLSASDILSIPSLNACEDPVCAAYLETLAADAPTCLVAGRVLSDYLDMVIQVCEQLPNDFPGSQAAWTHGTSTASGSGAGWFDSSAEITNVTSATPVPSSTPGVSNAHKLTPSLLVQALVALMVFSTHS